MIGQVDPTTAVLIPLKEKRRINRRGAKNRPNPGTAGNGRAGSHKNARYVKKQGKNAKRQGNGPRKIAYGPF